MNLYITRHGQTDWNAIRKIQGRTDIPLNDTGRQQAATTSDELKDVDFDVIFTSPLIRAVETAKIINELHHVPILQDERVIERSFGENEGTNIEDMDFSKFWHPNQTHLYPTSESVNDFYDRIYHFIDEIKETYRGKNVLVVAHGGVSLPFYTYFNGIPDAIDMRPFMLNNCQVASYKTEE